MEKSAFLHEMLNIGPILAEHWYNIIHCVSNNDNDVLCYNFNAHQPILMIFGRDIAEWISC